MADSNDGNETAIDKLRRAAILALGRIKSKREWRDWLAVEAYCATGRRWAMRMSNSNTPNGRRYADAFAVWLDRNPRFRDDIAKQERNDLMRCGESLAAIEVFRATLEPKRQRALQHPTSVWRAFKADKARQEREEALERAEALARDSVKAGDGTPFNAPVLPPLGGHQSEIILHKDDGASLIVVTLKRAYAKPMLIAIARELVRVSGLTVAEIFE
ncbi:MAG: hypothetical protein CR217_18730 [Beijerinckiaceae bacterium]|nr:MAG: hypothetical protein CR217_18730 [Beijerinckiaceae bacterium]